MILYCKKQRGTCIVLFTREADYAVRILRALRYGEKLSVQEISKKEHITVKVAYKLASKLESSCIIKSFRGSKGGYALNKPLAEITLYDVAVALDRNLLVNECMTEGFECSRNCKQDPCGVHIAFLELQELINENLKSKSLEKIF